MILSAIWLVCAWWIDLGEGLFAYSELAESAEVALIVEAALMVMVGALAWGPLVLGVLWSFFLMNSLVGLVIALWKRDPLRAVGPLRIDVRHWHWCALSIWTDDDLFLPLGQIVFVLLMTFGWLFILVKGLAYAIRLPEGLSADGTSGTRFLPTWWLGFALITCAFLLISSIYPGALDFDVASIVLIGVIGSFVMGGAHLFIEALVRARGRSDRSSVTRPTILRVATGAAAITTTVLALSFEWPRRAAFRAFQRQFDELVGNSIFRRAPRAMRGVLGRRLPGPGPARRHVLSNLFAPGIRRHAVFRIRAPAERPGIALRSSGV